MKIVSNCCFVMSILLFVMSVALLFLLENVNNGNGVFLILNDNIHNVNIVAMWVMTILAFVVMIVTYKFVKNKNDKQINIGLVLTLIIFIASVVSTFMNGWLLDEYKIDQSHNLFEIYSDLSWISLLIAFVLLIVYLYIYSNTRKNLEK